jgi:cytochrome c553
MRFCLLFIAAVAADAADDPYAAALFKKHCASCHESASAAAARIPPLATLKMLTPTAIFRMLDSGAMKTQAAPLSVNERQAVANFLGTAVTSERKRDEIANPCPAGTGWKDGPGWPSWGPGLANTRYSGRSFLGIARRPSAGVFDGRREDHRGYDTVRDFKTVNGVAGKGGAIDVGGPILAGGMLFAVSGSAQRGNMPGNVLIAFGVER